MQHYQLANYKDWYMYEYHIESLLLLSDAFYFSFLMMKQVRQYDPFIVVETNGDKLSGSTGFNDVAG